MVVFPTKACIGGGGGEIIFPGLQIDGGIGGNGRQEFIHIGDMNLSVLAGLHHWHLRPSGRLPGHHTHFHGDQVSGSELLSIRVHGHHILRPLRGIVKAAGLHGHRVAVATEHAVELVVVDIQAAQVNTGAIGVDQAAVEEFAPVSVNFRIDDCNVVGAENLKHTVCQSAIKEFAVLKEDIRAPGDVYTAHTALINIRAIHMDVLTAAQIDSSDAAAVEPGALDFQTAAALKIQDSAHAAALLLGVTHRDFRNADIVGIVKAQHIGIAGFGGNGHRKGLRPGDGQAGDIGDHQLIAVEHGFPVVVFPTGTAIALGLGQIILAGGKDDFRIRSNGRQKFIHRGHLDDVRALRLPGKFLCLG